jgi:hypothetical protein
MLIDATELLRRIDQMSPACREPQVFMDRPHCNCMVGIDGVRQIIVALSVEVDAHYACAGGVV